MNQTPADYFADLHLNPEYWMSKARALRASAGALLCCQRGLPNDELSRKLGANPPDMAGTWEVYRMLCGMSLELAYKASFLARGTPIKKTHDLVGLAEEVLGGLSRKKRLLLALLSECVIWEGRYPCPRETRAWEYFAYLSYESQFKKVRQGNLTTFEPLDPNPLDWEGYSELWSSAVAAFEWHRS